MNYDGQNKLLSNLLNDIIARHRKSSKQTALAVYNCFERMWIDTLRSSQLRLELAANAVTKKYEVSWEMVANHTSASGDFAMAAYCQIFGMGHYGQFQYLGTGFGVLTDENFFETDGRIKIPRLSEYKYFDLLCDCEEKTMLLTFKPEVVETLKLNCSSLRFDQPPYPSESTLNDYTQYIRQFIEMMEIKEQRSEDLKLIKAELLVRAILDDVSPMLGHKDSGYRLKLSVNDSRVMTVNLEDSYRDDSIAGGGEPLVVKFDLEHGSFEGLCDAWRLAFKRWSLSEVKAARVVVDEYQRRVEGIHGVHDELLDLLKR